MGAGSRHALGMLKYYYYEIDGAWGGGEHEMNYTAGGGKGGVAMGAGTDLGMYWACLNTIIIR